MRLKYLILLVIILYSSCADDKGSNENINLINLAISVFHSEIQLIKNPPHISKYCQECGKVGYLKSCDGMCIISEINDYRYAVGEVIPESKRSEYLNNLIETGIISSSDVSSYFSPKIISRAEAKNYDRETCVLSFDMPLIIDDQAWVGIH